MKHYKKRKKRYETKVIVIETQLEQTSAKYNAQQNFPIEIQVEIS